MTTMIIIAMMRKNTAVAMADAAEDGDEDADPVNGGRLMMVMLHAADADVDDDDGGAATITTSPCSRKRESR